MNIYGLIGTILLLLILCYCKYFYSSRDYFTANTKKPVINDEDKSQYINCRVDVAYCLAPPNISMGLKNIIVNPVSPEIIKDRYDKHPDKSGRKEPVVFDNLEICNSAANTLTHLECIRNYTLNSGEKRNSCCLISAIPIDDTYRELWRESLEKVCDNAPSKWDIIVLAYNGGKPGTQISMYETFSPDYEPKVYIIRSETCDAIVKSMYLPESKKFNIILRDTNTAGINKTLFESHNTYVYKYPFFASPDAATKEKQDNLMYERDSELYKSAEIVVARYNESLEWLKKYPYNKLPVVVYNKGPTDDYYKSPNMIREIKLPNLGKCDHTYVQHIVDNYDKLKDVTVFLTGSVDTLPHKTRNSRLIIESLDRDLRSTMVVSYYPDIRKTLHSFVLSHWDSSDKRNKTGGAKLYPAEVRPFGKWFEKKFGDLVVNAVAYYGIFSASRDHIKNRGVDFYRELLRELSVSQNPEVGHYVERSWLAIFHPMKGVKLLT